jgi:hypothetical protein
MSENKKVWVIMAVSDDDYNLEKIFISKTKASWYCYELAMNNKDKNWEFSMEPCELDEEEEIIN